MGILTVENITKEFGDLVAVDGVSFSIAEGDLTAIIGPNGAGKTTLFDMISGALTPTEGSVKLRGTDITGKSSHEVTNRGIARTFQIISLFPNLTTFETVRLAVQREYTNDYDLLSKIDEIEEVTEMTHKVIDRVGLDNVANQTVRDLPYGDRRKLEVALTLAIDPDIMLLDEPTSGLAVDEVEPIRDLILELSRDYTILFIEHDVDMTLEISEEIYVMSQGSIISSGPPADIRGDKNVRSVYLGDQYA